MDRKNANFGETQLKQIIFFLFLSCFIFGKEPEQIKTLYFSLNQKSIRENLAFYSLFPEDPYGKRALENALGLINCHRYEKLPESMIKNWPQINIGNIVQLIGKKMNAQTTPLSREESTFIKTISSHLKNRELKGHQLTKFEDSIQLNDNEIDLARALFLYQFQNDLDQVEAYEATLDLMALEILAGLPKERTVTQILHAMHELIFFEMNFRFPPHSLWAKDVDTFTFLPSVMDDRFGVCLGVSVLYLSLGQRLGLPFNIYTPPGHIFIQARLEDESLVNIETTARGIHIPMDDYLGINVLQLPKRKIKEAMALVLMNYAATFWEDKKYEEALKIYLTAETIMPEDPLLHYFITLNALFCDKKSIAKKAYAIYKEKSIPDVIKKETLLEDYYSKAINIEGLKAIFSSVDETRDSILKKQKELMGILQKYPNFREGHFHLGITHLQLSNLAKAKSCFENYHLLDQTNPTVEYYLAHLCINRLDFKKAYLHLMKAENLMKTHGKSIKVLKPIRMEILKYLCKD